MWIRFGLCDSSSAGHVGFFLLFHIPLDTHFIDSSVSDITELLRLNKSFDDFRDGIMTLIYVLMKNMNQLVISS